MRFALVGDHPDGLAMARALAATGRHTLIIYAGSAAGLEVLGRDGLVPRRVGDFEEALAEPGLEFVIIAGTAGRRAAQLRRALQSELHALCVHPLDPSADVGYEAALLQSDVQRILVPLLPESLHPGFRRLAQLTRARGDQFRLLEYERWSAEENLLDSGGPDSKPGLPGWDVLRLLGGEIAEVSAIAAESELRPGAPLVLSGRFQNERLWRAEFLPDQQKAFLRLTLVGGEKRTELIFPEGWPGPAELTYHDDQNQPRQEAWEAANPWLALVDLFEDTVKAWNCRRRLPQPGVMETGSLTSESPRLAWLDEIRSLELDNAVRRSLRYRRVSALEQPEATEEASFKGAMTLVGCSLLWLSLLLLIASVWVPQLGYAIPVIFGIFLLMQAFRWIVPEQGVRRASGGQADVVEGARGKESEVGNQESISPDGRGRVETAIQPSKPPARELGKEKDDRVERHHRSDS